MSVQNILSLKDKVTYGPVNSRRLGFSLGINLLPAAKKYCSFNCLYCQYGPALLKNESDQQVFPTVERVLREVKEAILKLESSPNYLTFSGHGEPTLYPAFKQVVEGLRSVRDKYSKNSKIALFTNGTQLANPEIKEAMVLIDVCIVKLDCANETMLRKYNIPNVKISLDEIISGMKDLNNLTIQALFTGGKRGNFREDHIREWIELVKDIRPREVQIYSVSRGYASKEIEPVLIEDLQKISKTLTDAGIKAQAY